MALQRRGVDAALAVLNEGTSCRFTAVFELDGPNLVNRNLFDRLGAPRAEYLKVVSFDLPSNFTSIVSARCPPIGCPNSGVDFKVLTG